MSDGATAAQRFYGRWARLYDLLARRTPRIGALRADAVDALDLAPGDAVVEMGCGTGANLPFLRERVGDDGSVVGVDFTRGVLARARSQGDAPNVHLVRGDARRPPVAGPVDAVLATFVVGMLGDPAAAVERWCDLLRPGGRLVLVDAARSHRAYGPLVNGPFRALVFASTPGRGRFRGDGPAYAVLDRRVATARRALASCATVDVDEERTLGVVRVTGGVV